MTDAQRVLLGLTELLNPITLITKGLSDVPEWLRQLGV